MLKKWAMTLITGLTLLSVATACTAPQSQQTEKPAETAAVAAQPVATINGEPVTQEDLKFYEVINRIQIAMYKERDQAKYQGAELDRVMKFWDTQEEQALHPNTLLTQIIRLRAMALLGQEKGYTATPEAVDNELNQVKASYAASPGAQALIKEYGEKQFWDKQKSQYHMIVVVNRVQQDVIDQVKKANPKAEQKEINMLAQKQYEDLLVSQVGTLQIKVKNTKQND